jgi:hypothetical protein
MVMAADTHTELLRRTPHIPPMPGFGRASVDMFGELDGRHLASDYQQASDLALYPADSGSVRRDNDGARSIRRGGAYFYWEGGPISRDALVCEVFPAMVAAQPCEAIKIVGKEAYL